LPQSLEKVNCHMNYFHREVLYQRVTGRSVTDLEIDFGVFRDPEQRRRSLFFLRDPLPYDTMGANAVRYADTYAPAADEGARARVDRLDKLKDRIRREFPGHVRTYPATWDEVAGRVTGLGSMLFGSATQHARPGLIPCRRPAQIRRNRYTPPRPLNHRG